MTRRILLSLVFLIVVPAFVVAQTPVTKTQTVSATATIQAIDSTSRTITLRSDKGEEDTFQAGPELKRFNELKVGDKVKATYWESVVMQVLPPGAAAPAGSTSAAVTPGKGKSPAATAAVQQTTTVTVKAIDPKVPSVTVTTEDGRTVTRKIEDPNNVAKLKVGDKVSITYTQALLVTVEPAK
jgi:Cu/Ag efflux protein CusF